MKTSLATPFELGRHLKYLAIAATIILLLIQMPSLCRAQMRLGNLSFATAAAENLDEEIPLAKGKKSYRFLSRVGGVAFGGIAVPKGSLKVVGLKYDETAIDGQRLKVTLKHGKKRVTVVAPVYDWQLIPIARFAANNYHAAFTLFGKLKTHADEQAHRERGERILNYHVAFADTLLGLRLFQADILILNSNAAQLPQVAGKVILGAGEQLPDVKANQKRLARLMEFIKKLKDGPFRSYVVSDLDQTVTFSIGQDNHLVLTGFPLWHCWKGTTSDPSQIQIIQQAANQQAQVERRKLLEQDRKTLSDDQLRAKYTEEYQQGLHDEIFDREVSRSLVKQMPNYSRQLSAKIRELDGINPAVYQALTTTMRYAAFLRYVRQQSPAVFREFLKKLNRSSVYPTVKTPSIMIPAPE